MKGARVFVDGEPLPGVKSVRVKLSSPPAFLQGRRVQRSPNVPEGRLFASFGMGPIAVGPLTYFSLTHDGRYPFETHYCAGRRELNRDRRRHVPQRAWLAARSMGLVDALDHPR